MIELCPLCLSEETSLFFTSSDRTAKRLFFLCRICDLVFVPKKYHLRPLAEKERYLTHNNDPEDGRYRDFLARLFDHLHPRLTPGATGLDYGAGPGPALATMMREAGFIVRVYDPFFHQDPSALEREYDFITCTETAEHFSGPRDEFERFQALLKPSGWLGIMTAMLDTWRGFPDWHYHRDPTHISFYSASTMLWIGNHYLWDVLFPRQNVVLFQKTGTQTDRCGMC